MTTKLDRDENRVMIGLLEENTGTEDERIAAIRTRFNAALWRRMSEKDSLANPCAPSR